MSNSFKTRIAILSFIGTLVIAAGMAIVGIAQYRELMGQVSDRSLSAAQSVQKYFLLQRSQQLENASNIVASNPNFSAYIAHAFGDGSTLGGVDTASIRDLISERREDLNADVVAILNVAGKVIAFSGDGQSETLDLSRNPILERAKKTDNAVSGFLVQGKRMLLITCTSLRRGSDIQAMLLTGQKIDANVIAQAARLSNADLALVVQSGTTWELVASNVDERVSQRLPLAMQLVTANDTAAEHSENLSTDDGIWVFRAAPLIGSEGNVSLISLIPPTLRSRLIEAIISPLIYVGASMVALLLLFSLLSWIRFGRPLDHLAQLSTRATQGDHALEFSMKTKGVVGRLGDGFNYLTRALSRYRVPSGTPTRRATDRHAG